MVLRLILVGLVAGLGLSLPSRRDLDALGRSAQRWANARLAEWDAGTSIEESSFVLIAEPVIPTAGTPAGNPVVSDHDFAVVVDETVASFALDAMTSRGRETADVVSEIAPPVRRESLALALPTEPATDDRDRLDVAFEAVMDETVAAFAADESGLDRQQALEAVAFEGWAAEMVRFMSTEVEVATTLAAIPAYEPLEIDENLYPGEAYALNRISSGWAETEEPVVEEPVVPVSRLTHAVRLTREAVVAWASLLHGPAVVTIGR